VPSFHALGSRTECSRHRSLNGVEAHRSASMSSLCWDDVAIAVSVSLLLRVKRCDRVTTPESVEHSLAGAARGADRRLHLPTEASSLAGHSRLCILSVGCTASLGKPSNAPLGRTASPPSIDVGVAEPRSPPPASRVMGRG
jgi:hypothetical protein